MRVCYIPDNAANTCFLVCFGFGRYKRKFYSGIQSIRLKKGYTYTGKLTRTLKSYANYGIPMMKTFKSQY